MKGKEDPIPVVVRCSRCGAVLDAIDDAPLREAVLWGYLAQKKHDEECHAAGP